MTTAVILAGGLGTRLLEETATKPKPMVEIGGMPILWHIMKIYAAQGVQDFIICGGYKHHIIKEFFANYHMRSADMSFDLGTGVHKIHTGSAETWKVRVVDTGKDTMTGGRVKRIAHLLKDEPFFMTYGDGLADVDIKALMAFHKEKKAQATITAVYPPPRFGDLEIKDGMVVKFREKMLQAQPRINGGYMVLDRDFIDLIDGDPTTLEQEPMHKVVAAGRLAAYPHDGFWQCMDNLREKHMLEDMWESGKAPWKMWA